MPLHVSSTMCSSSGGQNCISQPLVSSHLHVWWYQRLYNNLAHFSMLKLVYYILVYGARRRLMLDGDSLILLDIMKVDFTTCFILSRQSFNHARHFSICNLHVYFVVTSTVQVWWFQILYNTILTSWWWAHSARNM